MKNPAAAIAAVLVASSLLGCGGGGPSGGSSSTQQLTPAPAMQVLPATFDFGRVTTGNTSAPLEVTIRNGGTAALTVSAIDLTSTAGYSLNYAGGTRPCGSRTPTVTPGDSCTFQVAFQPSGNAAYSSSVRIVSNDSRTPTFDLPLSGSLEAVTKLNVQINQVDVASCPNPDATAYVSVTDQGGYPFAKLNVSNFKVFQNGSSLALSAFQEASTRPVAIAAVVDNSGSILNQQVAYADMKNGFKSLFEKLSSADKAELINFGSVYEVTVPFTSDKAALLAALAAPVNLGTNTLLYDTLYQAVQDTAKQATYRKAVVVATDGKDDGGTGTPISKVTLPQLKELAIAEGVPIFPVGVGTDVRTADLQDLAASTGGVFYRASTSQNLATIYAQLGSLLFQGQYALDFKRLPVSSGTTATLRIEATEPNGVKGADEAAMVSCTN